MGNWEEKAHGKERLRKKNEEVKKMGIGMRKLMGSRN